MLGEGEVTRNPDLLTEALRDVALPTVPRIASDKIQSEYRHVKRSWRSRRLWRGTSQRATLIIADNLNNYEERRPDLRGFSFETYEDQQCAQVNIHFGGGGSWGTFLGFRIWRCLGTDDVFVCGPRDAQFFGPGAWPERAVRAMRSLIRMPGDS